MRGGPGAAVRPGVQALPGRRDEQAGATARLPRDRDLTWMQAVAGFRGRLPGQPTSLS